MKRVIRFCFILVASMIVCVVGAAGKVEAKKNFTVSPNSKPYKNQNVNAKPYNKYTRQYIMLNTYLNYMGKHGGGTLTLKKGTYNLTNALLVPSNVTIVLKDGVTLNKTNNTHTKYLKAGHVMFELVRPSRIHKKGVLGKYKGEKNVKIIGKGNATINLGKCANSEGIRIPHCKNVTIQGVNFKNLRNGHFIEVVASKNVSITDCSFSNCMDGTRCAVNVDWACQGGFNGAYSKFDKTPVNNLAIKGCQFNNLYAGIDSHVSIDAMPHTNIQITESSFTGIEGYCIQMMDWKDIVIQNNTFSDVQEVMSDEELMHRVISDRSFRYQNSNLLFNGYSLANTKQN